MNREFGVEDREPSGVYQTRGIGSIIGAFVSDALALKVTLQARKQLARHTRKGLLNSLLVMKNGSSTIIQRRENHKDYVAMIQYRQPSQI